MTTLMNTKIKKTKFVPSKNYKDEEETSSEDDLGSDFGDDDEEKSADKTLKKPTAQARKLKITKQILRPRFRKHKPIKRTRERGVVYLSHIPHGFYEKEMRSYFKQFGIVTGVNIPRSKKTRNHKGYGFVEFLYPEVAKVVAETMNNHLMCNKVMKAEYVPPEKQKPHFFQYVYPRTTLVQKRRIFLLRKNRKQRNEEETGKEQKALFKRLARNSNKLKKFGVENYTFPIGGIELNETAKN